MTISESQRMSAREYRQLMGIDIPGVTIGEVQVVSKDAQKRLAESATRRDKAVAMAFNKADLGPFSGVGEIIATKKPRKHEEDDLAMAVADYLELLKTQGKVVVFTHTPQETFTKSWATKNKNKAMGVRAGIPDFVIVFPTGVFFLELKKGNDSGGSFGRPTPSQVMWIEAIQKVYSLSNGGVTADIAYGWKQSKILIDAWAHNFAERSSV